MRNDIVQYYLSKKWGLESIVDSDGDGFTDAVEISLGSSAVDATDKPRLDLSDTVEAEIFGAEIKINTNGNNYVLTSTIADIVGTGDNPSLSLISGARYTFTHEGTGHPFQVTIGSIDVVVNSGESITIQIPADQTSNGSYVCTSHPSMTNTITISDESSGLDAVEGNLKLWLDASNIDALSNATLSDGDAISEWKDLSGNGNNMAQTIETEQPSYVPNGVNFVKDYMISNRVLEETNNNYTVITLIDPLDDTGFTYFGTITTLVEQIIGYLLGKIQIIQEK